MRHAPQKEKICLLLKKHHLASLLSIFLKLQSHIMQKADYIKTRFGSSARMHASPGQFYCNLALTAYKNDKPTFLNFPRSDASAKAISATRLSAKFLNEACTDKSATGAERYFIILLNSCGWLLRPAGERLRIMQIGMQSYREFPRRCSRITAGRVFNGLFYLVCAARAARSLCMHAPPTVIIIIAHPCKWRATNLARLHHDPLSLSHSKSAPLKCSNDNDDAPGAPAANCRFIQMTVNN
jgi:hypothetical protein